MAKRRSIFTIALVLTILVKCQANQYDTQFLPQESQDHVDELKSVGTWTDECNGDLEKTLIQFPSQNLSSACQDLQPFGFNQRDDGNCKRASLSCAIGPYGKLQWTNYRQKDQIRMHLQHEILDFKVTMSNESSLIIAYPQEKTMTIKREKSTSECSHEILSGALFKVVDCASSYIYHVGVFMTESALYHYKLETKEMLYIRFDRPEIDEEVHVIQEGVTTTATKMPLYNAHPVIPNPKGLDNLFKIAKGLKNGIVWSCAILDHLNCQSNDLPSSQKWLINHGFFDNTIIYLNIDLVKELTFTITLQNGVDHNLHMQTDGKHIQIQGNNGMCSSGFQSTSSSERVLLAIHERSMLFHLPSTFHGQVAFECIIDELTIANTHSIQITTDDPIKSTVLLSNWLYVQPQHSLTFIILSACLALILVILIIWFCWYKKCWKSKPSVLTTKPQRSTPTFATTLPTQPTFGQTDLSSPPGYYDIYKNRGSCDRVSAAYSYDTPLNEVADYYV